MDKIFNTGEAPKQYVGEYPAQVVSVDDPEKLMRVRVRVVEKFNGISDSELPWAEYRLPVGFRPEQGQFTPVKVDDWVWVDFPYNGDSRRPRITGSIHFCPGGKPNFPHDAWEGSGKFSHKRTSPEVSPTTSKYHSDIVFSQFGVLFEIIASTGEVRVTQKSSGSAVEIDKEGNVTAHSEKNLFASAKKDCELKIDGNLKITAGGTAHIESVGAMVLQGATIDLN